MSDMTLTKVLRGMAEYLTKTLDPIDRERWALTLRDSVDEIARLQREVAEAKEKLAEREATIDILVQRVHERDAELAEMKRERDETLMLAEHPDISNLRDLAQELVHRAQRIIELERDLAAERAKSAQLNNMVNTWAIRAEAHRQATEAEREAHAATKRELGEYQAILTEKGQTFARVLAERDEARALLRECRDYIRDERQPHPNSPVGQLLTRLDALLGEPR